MVVNICYGCLGWAGEVHPLLVSGSMCNPPLKPLVAGWRGHSPVAGRVAVVGSADMLAGDWLGRPGNSAACDALLAWLRPVCRHRAPPSDCNRDVQPAKHEAV